MNRFIVADETVHAGDKAMSLTFERLVEVLDYDPATGIFTWRKRSLDNFGTKRAANVWNARFAGRIAGSTTSAHGYREITIDRQMYLAHRLVWLLHHERFPAGMTDHINGNRHDNRIENLRDVSDQQNCRNTRRSERNTSSVVGVSWHILRGKWRSHIQVSGRQIHLGSFNDFNEAVAARKQAEARLGFYPGHGRSA